MKTGSRIPLALLMSFLLCACAASHDATTLPSAASREATALAATRTMSQQWNTLFPSLTSNAAQTGSPSTSPTAMPFESQTPTPASGVKYPCYNIFFPIVVETTWIYREINSSSGKVLKMYAGSVQGSSASISLWDLSTLARSDVTVTCQNGSITGLSQFEAGFLFLPRNGTFRIESVSGVIAPSEATLEAVNWNFSWNTDLEISGGFMVVDRQTSALYSITVPQSTIRMEWRTAGEGDAARESVTVDVDTYPKAVKVFMNTTFAILLSSDEKNQNVPGTLELSGTFWFEPYVGLVRMVVNPPDILLNGTTLSVDLDSFLELTRFTPPKW